MTRDRIVEIIHSRLSAPGKDHLLDMDFTALSDASHSSPETSFRPRAVPAPDRPCDSCRKRKAKCVKESSGGKCVLCNFHQRECTYLEAPVRRKRKRDEAGRNEAQDILHEV